MKTLALLGIDVGFSKTRRTTGLAWYVGGKVGSVVAYADWGDREARLPDDVFDACAIDGPLVPPASDPISMRGVERTMSRAPFQKRCKPGFSHFALGLTLRQAAAQTAKDVQPRLKPAAAPSAGHVFAG